MKTNYITKDTIKRKHCCMSFKTALKGMYKKCVCKMYI